MCHICGCNLSLSIIERYSDLCRITSDSKPWGRGGRLGVCLRCGTVQKPTDQQWRNDCQTIYEQYDIYHQSGGIEAQFFGENAASMNRSRRVVQALRHHLEMPSVGRLLDFGCGNGALLRVAAQEFPEWSFYGTELNDKYKDEVLSIPRIAGFSSEGLNGIAGNFEIITLVHVLEHLEEPGELLRRIRSRISPSGSLLVEVPNYLENPFDLLIADHATHFSLPALRELLVASGYTVTFDSVTWVPKENTILASPAQGREPQQVDRDAADVKPQVERAVEWLISVRGEAMSILDDRGPAVGIFGTSNAGRWLDGELGGRAAFFVDEDANRIGRTLAGRPIVAPDEAPQGSTVLLPLAPIQGIAVHKRLQERLKEVSWIRLGENSR